MNAPLFRQFHLSSDDGCGVRCDDGGAFVGPVALLKYAGGKWKPREGAELSRALSAIYGLPIDVSAKLGGIAAIAQALNDGDITRAQLTTLFAHFPDPPQLTKRAPSRDEIIELALSLDWAGLMKIDSVHYPSGAPDDEGGEFAPKDEGGGASDAIRGPAPDLAVAVPDIASDSAIYFGKPLTAEAFQAWVGAHQGVLKAPSFSGDTFNSEGAVDAAAAAVPKDKGGPDFQANPKLDAFVQAIARPLAQLDVGGGEQSERFISIGVNSDGQYVVTSIQILGTQGGTNITTPSGTVAMVHSHPGREYEQPAKADNQVAAVYNQSSFVVADGGKNIWEIGRNDGVISIRTITSDPIGPWEPFQRDTARYRFYSNSRYP